MQKLLTFPYLVFILLTSASCISSTDPEIVINPSLYEDMEYSVAYEKATTSLEMIDNFETKFTIQVTALSPKFRQAFSDRFKTLYNETQPVLTEASNKSAFFVSLFAANEDLIDLSDETLWNIQLLKSSETKKPIRVKKISNKSRWTPFFDGISPWTKEFLVLFDVPIGQTGEEFLKNPDTKLVLSNQSGKMTISW